MVEKTADLREMIDKIEKEVLKRFPKALNENEDY